MIELEDFSGTLHKVQYVDKISNKSKQHSGWIILLTALLLWPIALWLIISPLKGYEVRTDKGLVIHIPDYEYNRWKDYKQHFTS